MSDLLAPVLDSWDRQCRIVSNLAAVVEEGDLDIKSGPDEWSIVQQLNHIHGTRRFWLKQAAPEFLEGGPLYTRDETKDPDSDEAWVPCRDLAKLRIGLAESAAQVRRAVQSYVESGKPIGQYDHPILLMQHLVWHDGWHSGAIIHALRSAGKEPSDEWQEKNIWELWRGEE